MPRIKANNKLNERAKGNIIAENNRTNEGIIKQHIKFLKEILIFTNLKAKNNNPPDIPNRKIRQIKLNVKICPYGKTLSKPVLKNGLIAESSKLEILFPSSIAPNSANEIKILDIKVLIVIKLISGIRNKVDIKRIKVFLDEKFSFKTETDELGDFKAEKRTLKKLLVASLDIEILIEDPFSSIEFCNTLFPQDVQNKASVSS